MIIWNFLQDNAGAITVVFTIVGMLGAGIWRAYKAMQSASERRKKEISDQIVSKFAEIKNVLNANGERLDGIDERLIRVEGRQKEDSNRLDGIDERLTRVEGRQKEDSNRLDGIDERLTRVEDRQKEDSNRLKWVSKDISVLQADIRAIW